MTMPTINLPRAIVYSVAILVAGALVYTGKAHAELLLAPLFGAFLPSVRK